MDVQEVKSVKDSPDGKAFIATLKDHEVAESLHNNGRGNCKFVNSNKFEFFPVKGKINKKNKNWWDKWKVTFSIDNV